jgi:hypothetical protein
VIVNAIKEILGARMLGYNTEKTSHDLLLVF